MQFVMKEARRVSGSARAEDISSVHVLMGLIALSLTTGKNDYFSEHDKLEVQVDIAKVKEFFEKYNIQPSVALPYLEELSSQMTPDEVKERINATYLAMYVNDFKLNDPIPVTAIKMLRAIRDNEAQLLKEVSTMVDDEIAGIAESDIQEERADEFRKYSELKRYLSSTVKGQQHVINQFVEALENTAIFEDKKRKRPKAVFVFAGPPGVGKTMLAQESADKLGLSFRQYNMTDYTTHYQVGDLIGHNKVYRNSKPGNLTEFVKKNPNSIIIFDEVEKTHPSVMNLFHQMLDEGKMEDQHHNTDVDFKNTIIIFTTNAGKQLYENTVNCAGLSRKSILSALAAEKKLDEQGGKASEPVFPASIRSRMASGYPIMFNHLPSRILIEIINGVLKRNGSLFKEQYIDKKNTSDDESSGVIIDSRIGSLILFSEGAATDARVLSKQAENFFRKQINGLMKNQRHNEIKKLLLSRELSFLSLKVNEECEFSELLKNPYPSKILYCGDPVNLNILKDELKKDDSDRSVLEIIGVTKEPENEKEHEKSKELSEAAIKEIKKNDIMFVIIDTDALGITAAKRIFNDFREFTPESSVYLIEREELDEDEFDYFTGMGLADKINLCNLPMFIDQLHLIASESYLKQQANYLERKSNVISFEATSFVLDKENKSVEIKYGNFTSKRSVHAEDVESMLSSHERPNDRFDDIIGIKSAKKTFDHCVEFLKDPKSYINKGMEAPRGLLLYGPPGTGKTMLARALAGETDTAFFAVNASEFIAKWTGEGPEKIRELFRRARRYAPSIIFIDEIDSIGETRSGGTLTTLLTELDGFTVDVKRSVLVIAATNFEIERGKGGMGVLDPALVRRFDERVRVDLPDKEDRKKFLEIMLDKCINYDSAAEGVAEVVESIATLSIGESLSKLRNLITFVKKRAYGEPISAKILSLAYDEYIYGEERERDEDSRKRVAQHEAGHALVYSKTGKTPAVLTIVSRGGHEGYMMPDIDEDKIIYTKADLLGQIRTSLGGRAAELVCYGENEGLSVGASADLASATNVAYRMICLYGMDDSIGLVSHKSERLLDAAAPEITSRLKAVLSEELDKAKTLISDNRENFDKLVDALMVKEKLVQDEIEQILGQ